MQPDASSIPIVSEEVKQLLINLKEIGKEYRLKMNELKELAQTYDLILINDEKIFGLPLVLPFKEFYRSSERTSKMKKSMNAKRLEFLNPIKDTRKKGFTINENGDLVPMDSQVTETAIYPLDYRPMFIHN